MQGSILNMHRVGYTLLCLIDSYTSRVLIACRAASWETMQIKTGRPDQRCRQGSILQIHAN